jgi:hypothetical protein
VTSTIAGIRKTIQEKGWMKGKSVGPDGQVCVSQAASVTCQLSMISMPSISMSSLSKAAVYSNDYTAAGELILAAVQELFPERLECTCSDGVLALSMAATFLGKGGVLISPDRGACTGWRLVVHFNDHEDTTLEDLLLVLKHAEVAEERESDAVGDRH